MTRYSSTVVPDSKLPIDRGQRDWEQLLRINCAALRRSDMKNRGGGSQPRDGGGNADFSRPSSRAHQQHA